MDPLTQEQRSLTRKRAGSAVLRIKPRAKSKRRGVEVLELILVLPILFLTLVAGIQFASVIAVDATICHASLEASRLASMDCDTATISDRVNEFLDVHGMSLASGTRMVVEDDSGILHSLGDPTLSSSTIGTPVAADCVRTTLLVETNASPIPNTLRDYCVDYRDKQFEHVSVATRSNCDCTE